MNRRALVTGFASGLAPDEYSRAAVALGYDSEAFSCAFKRQVGTPPASWRRERDAALADADHAAH